MLSAKAVCVDLDGTLANIEHRLKYINTPVPDWDTFYEKCDQDLVNEWCAELIRTFLRGGTDVHCVSARDRRVLAKTNAWIEKGVFTPWRPTTDYGHFYLHLLRDGKSVPDVDLKRAWLQQFGKENVLFVVDDRQRVVDYWRSEGVTCLQCYAWPDYDRKSARAALSQAGKR